MTQENRIAMGRGTQSTVYHFDFLDIDFKTKNEIDDEGDNSKQEMPKLTEEQFVQLLLQIPKELLVYKTQHGYHIVYPSHVQTRYEFPRWLKELVDPKCPHNAIRIYPSTDYKLIQVPTERWCNRINGVYKSIFGNTFHIDSQPDIEYSCVIPLKFGIYTVENNGKKLFGKDRITQ